jgi:hypothetical protein
VDGYCVWQFTMLPKPMQLVVVGKRCYAALWLC